jgi:hypothetical protein
LFVWHLLLPSGVVSLLFDIFAPFSVHSADPYTNYGNHMYKLSRVITPMQEYTRSVDGRSVYGRSSLIVNVYRATAAWSSFLSTGYSARSSSYSHSALPPKIPPMIPRTQLCMTWSQTVLRTALIASSSPNIHLWNASHRPISSAFAAPRQLVA